jgi:hypothetical protein
MLMWQIQYQFFRFDLLKFLIFPVKVYRHPISEVLTYLFPLWNLFQQREQSYILFPP